MADKISENDIREKYNTLDNDSKQEYLEETYEILEDKIEEEKENNIDSLDDYVKVEKLLQESIDISKETEEVIELSEAGNLSDVVFREYKLRVNKYLSSLNQDTYLASGLQNDSAVVAGLLNVKTDIKNAATTVAELAAKAIANIIKFFSDMFTKILTKTKTLETKLDTLDKFLARNSNELEINFSAFRSIFMQFELVSLANGWDKKAPTVEGVFTEMIDLVNTMKTSKIPKISLKPDSLVNTKEYINENKTTLEAELISYFLDNDSRAKELKLSRDRIKVIRIARDRVDFAVFSEDEREVIITYMRSDRDPKVRIKPFVIVDKMYVSILIEALSEATRHLKTKLRNDTESRIKSLKDASNKLVSEFQKASSDIKDPEEKTKWDILSRDIKNIWTVYPLIGNKSLLNLYSIINKLLDWLLAINKIELNPKDESLENKNI